MSITEIVRTDDKVILIEWVERLIRAGAIYGRAMPKGLPDVTMDIIFKLFVNMEKGHETCVKQLVSDAGASATGVLRRIELLEEAGLVRRTPDLADGRRMLVALTERGRAMVLAMVGQVFGPAPGPGAQPNGGHERPYAPPRHNQPA